MADLHMFVVALAVVYLLPGADMILLLETGARSGRAAALATAAGLAVARVLHVSLSGLGLGALIAAAPLAFEIVRFGGSAYLVGLGFAILLAPRTGPTPATRTIERSLVTAFRHGLLTNLLNPKALLFCSVLLPQFVRPDHGGTAVQFELLGGILVAVGVAFDVVYATMGDMLGAWGEGRSSFQTWQRRSFGSVLIGFGLRLALAPHP
jgi:threonine/homoserine/homoserine lactone efflux protein